jgi:hypothetical protein
MSAPTPSPRRDPGSLRTGPALAGFGLAVLAIACCTGPALLAAGVLGAIGGALANPFVIAAAVLLVAGTVVYLLRRRSGRADCCPPADRDRLGDPTGLPVEADGLGAGARRGGESPDAYDLHTTS